MIVQNQPEFEGGGGAENLFCELPTATTVEDIEALLAYRCDSDALLSSLSD